MAEPTTDIAVLTRHLDVAGRSTLDVGCGNGWFARELAARGARVTGVEISDAQLAAARAADPGADAGAPVRYVVGRGESLPVDDGSQDLVVFMRALHHVPPDAIGAALGEARRALRRGGRLVVIEPLSEGELFALVSLVEDETDARRAAVDALAAATGESLRHLAGERYAVAAHYDDLAGFHEHMVSVDPGRAAELDAHHEAVARAFAAGTADGARGRRFRAEQRLDVFEAV